MRTMFCTMAIGESYAKMARYLVADLRDYQQQILILTDYPILFQQFSNVVIREHRPHFFSYHDKRLALKEALKLAKTAVFIDADCIFRFGLDRELVSNSLRFEFPPGFHVWKVSTIKDAGPYVYPEKEEIGRSLGLVFDRDRITYQEMLFAISKEDGKEDGFFDLWGIFERESTSKNDPGRGEGTCMGISAQGSGLTCHDSKYMEQSMLPKLFWHCKMKYEMRAYHHFKYKLLRMLELRAGPDMSRSAL